MKTSWIAYRKVKAQACLRVFCFPYAGSGAAIYRAWMKDLPETIELCPVQLPGRETRALEPACSRIGPLVEALSEELRPFLDLPYVFFGYSMGALIAFELARALRKCAAPVPSHLFLAARRGPRILDPCPTGNLNNREFARQLAVIGGTPKEILQNPDLLELVLPTLRADFTLCENYAYLPDDPLDCPMTICGGKEDAKTNQQALDAWGEETRASCDVKWFEGDHFFIHSCQAALLQTILDVVSSNLLLADRSASPSFV